MLGTLEAQRGAAGVPTGAPSNTPLPALPAARLDVQPDGREVEVAPGETILQATLRAGVPHAHACGGQARCSTCRVFVSRGTEQLPPRNARERALAERLGFEPRVRLACQVAPQGDVAIRRLVLDDEDLALTNQLGRRAADAPTEGREQQVAILFADIRGFTAFAEPLPPYDVIFVLNRFFNTMGRAIERHGGTINNYMGDGLMALFGVNMRASEEGAAREPSPEAPLAAVRAGLEMLDAAAAQRPYFAATYGTEWEIGVGIHYGPAVIGSLGYGRSRRLSAIGDAVNLASRIEAANKIAGTRLLVSEPTYSLVGAQATAGRTVRLPLKGKRGEHTLYEVVGLTESAAPTVR